MGSTCGQSKCCNVSTCCAAKGDEVGETKFDEHRLMYKISDVDPIYLERYHDPDVKTKKLKDKYDLFYRECAIPFIHIHVNDFFQILTYLKI